MAGAMLLVVTAQQHKKTMAEIKLIKVTHQQSRLEFFKKQLDKATRSMNYHVKRKHHQDICAEYGEIVSFYEWAVDKAKEPGWIPVSERLPEVDGKFLVHRIIFGGVSTMSVVGFARNGKKVHEYDLRKKKNVWYEYDSEVGYYALDTVTHWMPLPEPPKEV